jgi:hypothetical protein
MSDDIRTWPIGLRRLAEVIGAAAAVRLADAFGGKENIRIPNVARVEHPFTAIIGLDLMEKLCSEFHGERIEIPRGVFKDLKKAQILGSTGTNWEVASRVGCTQRYVRWVRNSVEDTSQIDLFKSE